MFKKKKESCKVVNVDFTKLSLYPKTANLNFKEVRKMEKKQLKEVFASVLSATYEVKITGS